MRGFEIGCLPVNYYHQKNSWMTGEILHSNLSWFNQKVKNQIISVLHFLENAGCHPQQVIQGYIRM